MPFDDLSAWESPINKAKGANKENGPYTMYSKVGLKYI